MAHRWPKPCPAVQVYDRPLQEPKRILPRKALRNASNEPLQAPNPAPQPGPKPLPPPEPPQPPPTRAPLSKHKQQAAPPQPPALPAQQPPLQQHTKQEPPRQDLKLARLRSQPPRLQNPARRASLDPAVWAPLPAAAAQGQARSCSVQSENPPQSPGFEYRVSVDSPPSGQQPKRRDRLWSTQSTAAEYRRTTGESSVIGLAQLQQVRERGQTRNTKELGFKQVSPLVPSGGLEPSGMRQP